MVYVVIKVGRRATKVGPACHKGWVPVPAACPHALLPYAVSLIHPSQGPLRRHDPLLTLYSHHARRPILCGTTRASAHPFWHAGPTVVAKGGKATLRSAQPL